MEQAGVAAVNAGRIELAEPTLRDLIERRLALGDRPGAARATAALGRGMVNALEPGAARRAARAAVGGVRRPRADAALADIEHQLARAYWFNDRLEQAIELADRALGRAERIEAVGIIADALITKGVLLAWGSRPYEGNGFGRGRRAPRRGAWPARDARSWTPEPRGHRARAPAAPRVGSEPRSPRARGTLRVRQQLRHGARQRGGGRGRHRGMGLGAGCHDRRGDQVTWRPRTGRRPCVPGRDPRGSRRAGGRAPRRIRSADRGDHGRADVVEPGLHAGRGRVCGRSLPRRRRRLAAVVRYEHRERVDGRGPGRQGDAVGGRRRRPPGDADTPRGSQPARIVHGAPAPDRGRRDRGHRRRPGRRAGVVPGSPCASWRNASSCTSRRWCRSTWPACWER